MLPGTSLSTAAADTAWCEVRAPALGPTMILLTILSLLTPFLAAASFRSLGSVAAILNTDTGLPSSLELPGKWVQQPQATS